jgi:hypothetical protein
MFGDNLLGALGVPGGGQAFSQFCILLKYEPLAPKDQ